MKAVFDTKPTSAHDDDTAAQPQTTCPAQARASARINLFITLRQSLTGPSPTHGGTNPGPVASAHTAEG
jgi:hypothetical protein